MAVVSFKTLMGVAEVAAVPVSKEFTIFNENHWTSQNGGCCLQWTVPADIGMIKFEILSGGGPGGSSGHSHEEPVGGQGGNYAMIQLLAEDSDFTAGSSVYSLCAAGTSWCSCCDHCCTACRDGCPSYITGDGLTNFCAVGGRGGPTSWDVMSSCYNCKKSAQCNFGNYNAGWVQSTTYPGYCGIPTSPTTKSIGFTGTSGDMSHTYSCCSEGFVMAGVPSGPWSTSSGLSSDWCTTCFPCYAAHSNFPGGGGTGQPRATSSACWGFWGAGGLVKVTYQ